ncbi:hypothetical protein EUX98_g5151 [Antrodiella citrinella]|uniref:Peptidase C45 hydrolase domain-containing protein n=1 Tax=Antrodiella citrinella TaxID=2447956 RepID=A0A4S4MUQ5_9APHY|nr:hypothetical protein EUX98_g5151 [Antrodiella citrinella]
MAQPSNHYSSGSPMSNYTPPVVSLSGTHYEIGVQHGRLLHTQIRKQLSTYRRMFMDLSGMDWPEVREVAKQYHNTIHRKANYLLDEMRGIADGMGDETTVMDIVALNARSEIALGMWHDGCTSIGWHLTGTTKYEKKHGKQILAQNWDWRTEVGQNLALITIKQFNKPQIWMVTEPGLVGKIGLNSSSVGITLNAIRARKTSGELLPIHCLCRIALEATSVENAISRLHELGGSASCQAMLIADPTMCRGLELTPGHIFYLAENPQGLLAHTNHLLVAKDVDERPWMDGSQARYKRIHEICGEIAHTFDYDTLAKEVTPQLLRHNVFADRENAPQAISMSPSDSKEVETLFNIVMVFQRHEEPYAELIFGRPDQANGRVYSLPW